MKLLKLFLITALIMGGAGIFRTMKANSFGNHVVACRPAPSANFILGDYIAQVQTSDGDYYFTRVHLYACKEAGFGNFRF